MRAKRGNDGGGLEAQAEAGGDGAVFHAKNRRRDAVVQERNVAEELPLHELHAGVGVHGVDPWPFLAQGAYIKADFLRSLRRSGSGGGPLGGDSLLPAPATDASGGKPVGRSFRQRAGWAKANHESVLEPTGSLEVLNSPDWPAGMPARRC